MIWMQINQWFSLNFTITMHKLTQISQKWTLRDDFDLNMIVELGYGGSMDWEFAKRSFQMPLDGVFIGEKSLRSGSGSELRGTHPMRVGFGGFQMVTAHRFR